VPGDTDAAVGWLRSLFPEGPWYVYASDPEGRDPFLGERFAEEAALRAWLDARQGTHNVYYSANTPLPTVRTTPRKSQMVRLNVLHVDLDLPKTGPHATPTATNYERLLLRVRAMAPAPSAIVFSGGGYQVYWRLAEALPAAEYADRVEAVNAAIQRALAADHCFDVGRILRLPGTVNVPDKKKRERGREPALASAIEVDWSRTWSFALDPVPRLPDSFGAEEAENEAAEPPLGPHSLESLPRKLQRPIKTGDASAFKGNRSNLILWVACSLVRLGWKDEEIAPFLLDADYGLSAHCRDQSNPARAAQRTLDFARRSVAEDWERAANGQILRSWPANVRRGINLLDIKFSFDGFSGQPYINGVGPLRSLEDEEANHLRVTTFPTAHGFIPPKELWLDIVADLAWQASYHPVLDYLSDARDDWDGAPRIDTWLFDYGGVRRRVAADLLEQTETAERAAEVAELYNRYVSAVGRLMLVAAVRRVREPGCKFDEMMVLVNPKQGTNKSSALAILAVRKEWFLDSLPFNAKDQEVIEKLSGKWIVEFAELPGLRTSEVEHLKAFLSRDTDHSRMAYGRFTKHPRRQCVFFGSTNELWFLRDTENRRFWPIDGVVFDLEGLRKVVHQLWGEAAAAEASGESIRLDPALWDAAALVQAEHRIHDPWEFDLSAAMRDLEGRIAAVDAWKIVGKPGYQRTQEDNRRFGTAMRLLGWTRAHSKMHGRLVWCYERGPDQKTRSRPIYVQVDPLTREVYVSHDTAPQPEPDDDLF
jgi:predicted P-loop ATPase